MDSDEPREGAATAVRIERNFLAQPHEVWRAWTEPSIVSQWFGSDPDGTVLSARLDVRLGGSFEVTFKDSPGTVHTCGGSYVEVTPDRKLLFSWHWKSEPGVETLVSVELSKAGTGSRMIFEHSRLFTASAHDYRAGWERTFDKLERVLTPGV